MNFSLLLTSVFFTAPVPVPKPDPQEQAALERLAKFGFKVVAEDDLTPRGTSLRYEPERGKTPIPIEKDLADLGALRSLKRLDLTRAPITDDTLIGVGRLSGLEVLSLCSTR